MWFEEMNSFHGIQEPRLEQTEINLNWVEQNTYRVEQGRGVPRSGSKPLAPWQTGLHSAPANNSKQRTTNNKHLTIQPLPHSSIW